MPRDEETGRKDATREQVEPFEIFHAPADGITEDVGASGEPGTFGEAQRQASGAPSEDPEPVESPSAGDATAPFEMTLAVGGESAGDASSVPVEQPPVDQQGDLNVPAEPEGPSDASSQGPDAASEPTAQLDLSVTADLKVPPSAQTPLRSGSSQYSYELPLNAGPSRDADDAYERVFPPEYRYGPPRPTAGSVNSDGASDIGQPLPRVIVMVTMADPRDITHDAMREAAEFIAAKLQQLAKYEVDQAFWRQKCEQSAANYGRNWR